MKESKKASEIRERFVRGLFGPEFYNSKGEFRNTWRLYRADEIVQMLKGARNLGWNIKKMIEFFEAEASR